MASFTAKDIQALRQATGAGMMDAKKALTEADGNTEAATQALREKGLAKAAGREDRENNDGAIAIATSDSAVAMVHLQSETDFSAKSDDFIALVNELAAAVLVGGADAATAMVNKIDDLKIAKKENIQLGQVVFIEAGEGQAIDSYVHLQDGRGINGVVVLGEGVDSDTLHQIALHIAFAKPTVLTREEVDTDAIAAERSALLEITKAEGKPEQAWEKIVEGRLTGWFSDSVLLEQGLHGDKISVKETIGSGSIVSFAQSFNGA